MLTDAAMLRWLDGEKNTVRAPNENLAREFMELFTLGHGDGYTETDVREGARALTGWKIDADDSTPRSCPRQHDTATRRSSASPATSTTPASATRCSPARPRRATSRTRWWGQLRVRHARRAPSVLAR